jgi:hypothetical protein
MDPRLIFGLVMALYIGCGVTCMVARYAWAGLLKIVKRKSNA